MVLKAVIMQLFFFSDLVLSIFLIFLFKPVGIVFLSSFSALLSLLPYLHLLPILLLFSPLLLVREHLCSYTSHAVVSTI